MVCRARSSIGLAEQVRFGVRRGPQHKRCAVPGAGIGPHAEASAWRWRPGRRPGLPPLSRIQVARRHMSVFDRPSVPPAHPSTTSPRRDRPASLCCTLAAFPRPEASTWRWLPGRRADLPPVSPIQVPRRHMSLFDRPSAPPAHPSASMPREVDTQAAQEPPPRKRVASTADRLEDVKPRPAERVWHGSLATKPGNAEAPRVTRAIFIWALPPSLCAGCAGVW